MGSADAGQEVAREFFHAGGASGTIAKRISAYDMAFSDVIYGDVRAYLSSISAWSALVSHAAAAYR